MSRGLGFDIYARDLTKVAFASVAGQVQALQGQAIALKATLGSAFSGGNGLAGGAVGLVLAGGLVRATAASGNFEASMNRVQALSSATETQFLSLERQAKKLGATTQFSASQASSAMGFLAMAGFDANQVLQSMPGTLQLASAAQMDLAETADVVSNILTGYKLPVDQLSRANDVLVKTFISTNTNLQQLGQALKFVGPVASQAGLGFEQVSAAIGLMGNAGIQGEMAGTALRGSITKLLNPSREVQRIMKGLGLNFLDASGKIKKLDEIVVELTPHANDAGLFMKIFGQRAGPGMAALVGQGVGALRGLTKELENSGGTAKRIADVQMKGYNGSIKALKSAFEGLQIAIGGSGVLAFATASAVALTTLTSAVSALPDPVLAVGSAFGGVAASALLVGSAVALLTPAFVALKAVVVGLTVLAFNPFALVLGAVATATLFYYQHQKTATESAAKHAAAIKLVNAALGRQVANSEASSAATLVQAKSDVVAARAVLQHAEALRTKLKLESNARGGASRKSRFLPGLEDSVKKAELDLDSLSRTLQALSLQTVPAGLSVSIVPPSSSLKTTGVNSAKALKAGLDSVDPWKGMRAVTDQSAQHMMDEIKRVRDFNQQTMTGFVQGASSLLARGEMSWKSLAGVALNSISQISNSLINDLMGSIYKTSNAAGGMGNVFGTLFSSLLGGGSSVGLGAPTNIIPTGVSTGFAGWFADGGIIPAGQWGIAGEAGAEIIQGGTSGKTITPIDFSAASVAPSAANNNTKIELKLSSDLEARILQQAGSQAVSISNDAVADYDRNVAPQTAVNSVKSFNRAGGQV